jgi:hypothetical protein
MNADPPFFAPGASPDFADLSNFYDHYLPRVLGFALRRTADPQAAERLTEAILTETMSGGGPLVPSRETDEAILAAARRVAARAAAAGR